MRLIAVSTISYSLKLSRVLEKCKLHHYHITIIIIITIIVIIIAIINVVVPLLPLLPHFASYKHP